MVPHLLQKQKLPSGLFGPEAIFCLQFGHHNLYLRFQGFDAFY